MAAAAQVAVGGRLAVSIQRKFTGGQPRVWQVLQGQQRYIARELRAGMFVHVAVILPEQAEQLVVPLTSVVRAAYGNSIFVVEGESARQQFVKLGESRGDFVAVLDGLKDSDVVVSAGAFKLRNGSKVIVNNDVSAKPQQDPRPENR